jgi:hypothetical protein
MCCELQQIEDGPHFLSKSYMMNDYDLERGGIQQ